ncbi:MULTISPECIES: hypothetical protein [Jeotgalicoccus]|uniref:hypothetical protein n=1 Tax=Jeotgalicoccus TaxID=227979 RepID=UPI00041E2229|nr:MULTISPECIES: hypothetical protein [Jeotgalicoccus]QQD85329.1 hypothetical protein JEM45_01490 [Jeotgalicoccus sp. ATCC 8456]
MVKFFSIVLIILGTASFINVLMNLSSSILMSGVYLVAAIILLYVGNQMYRNSGKEE